MPAYAPSLTSTCNIRDYLRSFFRPRSLGINHHFSQKSALKQPFFRAPDWTYARGKLKCFTTCPGATRLWYASPRSAGTELALTRRRHPSDILSESFRHKWALFTGKCTTRALFPCARLDLYGLTCLPRCKHTHAYARQLTSSSSLLNIGSTWPLLLPTLTSATICALQVFSHASTYSCLRSQVRSHPRLSALFKSSHMQAHTLAYAHMPATSWYTIRIICLQRILFNIWRLLTSRELILRSHTLLSAPILLPTLPRSHTLLSAPQCNPYDERDSLLKKEQWVIFYNLFWE